MTVDLTKSSSNVINTLSSPKAKLATFEKRGNVALITAVALAVLSLIALAGVLGAGHVLFGVFLVGAAISGVYAYFCRQAAISARQEIERTNP